MHISQTNIPTVLSQHHKGRVQRLIMFCLLPVLFLGGCAPPAVRVHSSLDTPQKQPSTVVYFYPNHNQSEQQQERDRYECYLWAVDQSGYDPGQQALTPHQKVEVVSTTPPGSNVAAGAITGGALGSILAGRHSRPEGLILGVLAGAMIGLITEEEQKQQATNLQEKYDRVEQQRYNQLEQQAYNYRRAISACLEGRGYTVQ